MGIHHSRPSAQLTSEDLAIVSEQVVSQLGDIAGLPAVGPEGSLIVTADGSWVTTASGSPKASALTIWTGTEGEAWSEFRPWYSVFASYDGEDVQGVWIDPTQIAVSAPGEGPSDEGVNITRYEIRVQNATWYENFNITGYLEPNSMGVGEEFYDPESGSGYEWYTQFSTSDMQTGYYLWDDTHELTQYVSIQRNSFSMDYEDYGDNVDDEFELYMQTGLTSSFYFNDENGSMSMYTDYISFYQDNKGVTLDHQNGIGFDHYTTWSGEDGNWHWDRDPTFVYGPTQINYQDMWITPLASGISINSYGGSVEIQPHLIPEGAFVKNIGGQLVGVDINTEGLPAVEQYALIVGAVVDDLLQWVPTTQGDIKVRRLTYENPNPDGLTWILDEGLEVYEIRSGEGIDYSYFNSLESYYGVDGIYMSRDTTITRSGCSGNGLSYAQLDIAGLSIADYIPQSSDCSVVGWESAMGSGFWRITRRDSNNEITGNIQSIPFISLSDVDNSKSSTWYPTELRIGGTSYSDQMVVNEAYIQFPDGTQMDISNIQDGGLLKRVGNQFVTVSGYTGPVNVGNWIMTYEAGLLVSVEAD